MFVLNPELLDSVSGARKSAAELSDSRLQSRLDIAWRKTKKHIASKNQMKYTQWAQRTHELQREMLRRGLNPQLN